jgi:hypothetical protein
LTLRRSPSQPALNQRAFLFHINKLAAAYMAFTKGNQLGAKSRLFDGALKRAIAQDDGQRLRQAAEKLLDLAAGGEAWAIKELADRLDGKAQQNVSVERKNVSDLSLSELAAELATAIAGGSSEPADGAEQPSQVH